MTEALSSIKGVVWMVVAFYIYAIAIVRSLPLTSCSLHMLKKSKTFQVAYPASSK